jgi:predicted nucleic acid-binding protein
VQYAWGAGMNLLLDTGVLAQLCHPRKQQHQPVADWLAQLLRQGDKELEIFVPEISDYELRRKLLHLIGKKQAKPSGIERLNELGQLLEYLPLDTQTMKKAAELWAQARAQGIPTAEEKSLDSDVILAAQAMSVEGTIITTNRKHLERFVPAKEWTEIPLPPPKRKKTR